MQALNRRFYHKFIPSWIKPIKEMTWINTERIGEVDKDFNKFASSRTS